jgi:competence protein ComGF
MDWYQVRCSAFDDLLLHLSLVVLDDGLHLLLPFLQLLDFLLQFLGVLCDFLVVDH